MAAYCFAFFIMLGMFGACWAGCVREEMFFTDIVIKCSGEDVTSIPSNLDTNLQRLLVENTGIQEIDETTLAPYTNLRSLLITRNSHLAKLSGHIFSKNFLLSDIKITHNSQLSQIHPSTFDGVFKRGFRVLDLSHNRLDTVPDLSRFSLVNTTLPFSLVLDGNPLTIPAALCGQRSLGSPKLTCQFLSISIRETKMAYLHSFVLNGTKIIKLDLSNNKDLEGYDEDTFLKLAPDSLETLILSGNPKLTKLPSQGISSIRTLKCEDCINIKHIPPTVKYTNVREVYLTYPQHCCAFKNPQLQNKDAFQQSMENNKYRCPSTLGTPTISSTTTTSSTTSTASTITTKAAVEDSTLTTVSMWRRLGFDGFTADIQYFDEDLKELMGVLPDGHSIEFIQSTIDPSRNHYLPYDKNCTDADFVQLRKELICLPVENSFTPCVDIFEEKHYLRVVLWMVAINAVVGNFIVLTFTILSRLKGPLTVTKFLISNLAFSDALQGIYLLTLAAVDIKTLGEYFNYANWWQYGGGCDAIGFITVFASELSVYTLTVITLERWYAISHAIHLTKRIQMKQAVIIMLIGWLLSLTAAALPLIGFSSYQKTSLCLPFQLEDDNDKGYIISLLTFNVAAFVIVFFCYVSIFQQVRGSNASMASDTNLAKRMALLVFTDFICWGPVAIVAALSAGGVNIQRALITEENELFIAKIILVIFYPFNACANPFLYAIITKQFRKDCVLTLSSCGLYKRQHQPTPRRLEDSDKQQIVRNSQSHMSNTTMTNVASNTDQTRGNSIKSRSSTDTDVANNIHQMNEHDKDSISSKMALRNLSPKSHQKKRHSLPGSFVQRHCHESRRLSDTVNVPETLIEVEHHSASDQLENSSTIPMLSIGGDKWKSGRSMEIDSGAELNAVSESDWEDQYSERLMTQSDESSAFLSDESMSKQQIADSYCMSVGLLTQRSSGYNCESDCECDYECEQLTQYHLNSDNFQRLC